MPGLYMSAYAPSGPMAWSGPQYPAAVSTQSMLIPELKFFIERDDGSLVPLVPVDELPDGIRLVGVPLSLSTSQAKDMLFLGHESSARRKFSLAGTVNIKDTMAPTPVALEYTPQPEVAPHSNHVPQPGRTQPLPAPTPTFAPAPKPLNVTKPRPLYNERPLPPSGIEPDQKKKIYCTYWIQHQGQCSFKQQGCIYKHEIPEDKETLNSIGLKSVPAWWRKEQARKKQKGKLLERNRSSSEWEVVEQQQTGNSALHGDDPVRVRVPPSHPTGVPVIQEVAQKHRSEMAVQKDVASSDVPSDTATAGSSAPGPYSPPGGVKLGAAKTPVRGPPSLPLKKQTLDSPIEAEEEENLIDFEVLVPSSSPDIPSPSQSSPELLTDRQSKVEMVSRRSRIVAKGGVSISPGRGARSSNTDGTRRGSADKKASPTSLTRQHNSMAKGRVEGGREKVEYGNGVSRRGRVK
ncbi:hypothetical protein E4T49_01420 [Aureobasidium sp. EXF-10728]|nr:hypothetical protein E4T49_01420 [Aureobasidium sp. EXF-10728]